MRELCLACWLSHKSIGSHVWLLFCAPLDPIISCTDYYGTKLPILCTTHRQKVLIVGNQMHWKVINFRVGGQHVNAIYNRFQMNFLSTTSIPTTPISPGKTQLFKTLFLRIYCYLNWFFLFTFFPLNLIFSHKQIKKKKYKTSFLNVFCIF